MTLPGYIEIRAGGQSNHVEHLIVTMPLYMSLYDKLPKNTHTYVLMVSNIIMVCPNMSHNLCTVIVPPNISNNRTPRYMYSPHKVILFLFLGGRRPWNNYSRDGSQHYIQTLLIGNDIKQRVQYIDHRPPYCP